MKLSDKYNAIINKKERSEIRRLFSEKFGVSMQTIFNWLSGRSNPPERYHNAIAQIMGVTVAELFPDTAKCSA